MIHLIIYFALGLLIIFSLILMIQPGLRRFLENQYERSLECRREKNSVFFGRLYYRIVGPWEREVQGIYEIDSSISQDMRAYNMEGMEKKSSSNNNGPKNLYRNNSFTFNSGMQPTN